MRCPKCDGKLRTMDTIPYSDNSIYRRKKCLECGRLLYTMEFEVEQNGAFKKTLYDANKQKKKRGKTNG